MNPYEILGVSENATDEEIKTAYRELVKKYHPDKYQNNPLSELAEEKLREVNKAYEMLQSNSGTSSSVDFQEIRMNIDRNNLVQAEQLLNKSSVRNAEWYFLSGMLSYKKGWYDDAINKVQQAVNMDPNNYEYRDAFNRMQSMGHGYQGYASNYRQNSNTDAFCQALQCYLCLDCCCDCI